MDIGALTVSLGGRSLDDAAAYLDDISVDAVEIGAGGWSGENSSGKRGLDAPDGRLRGGALDRTGGLAHLPREGLERTVDVFGRAAFETRPGGAYWAA